MILFYRFGIESGKLIQLTENIEFDLARLEVIKDGKVIRLAQKESQILNYFYNNKARVISLDDLRHTAMQVEVDLLKSKLLDSNCKLDTTNFKLQVALLDKNRNIISSNLLYKNINISKKFSKKPKVYTFCKKLASPLHQVHFIITEDTRIPSEVKNLKILIYLTVFSSAIFIAFIGYLLSRLLLRPVQEKMHHIDKFIKDSAHEINTPVTALLMSVSSLKKKGLKESKLLRDISISLKQISDIYNTLSHLAFDDLKRNIDTNEIINLKTIIENSSAFYQEIASVKDIEIVLNTQTTYIKMDTDSAQKLVNNLISNAIKYNYTHKKIYITLQNNNLRVKDEGIGISKDDQNDILKRYKRATNLSGGFGIGLDIVNSICKKYQILLTIESQPKRGSTFMVDLTSIVI